MCNYGYSIAHECTYIRMMIMMMMMMMLMIMMMLMMIVVIMMMTSILAGLCMAVDREFEDISFMCI